MQIIKNEKTNKYAYLFIFGLVLTIIQQTPPFSEYFYGEIRFFLYIIFGFLSIKNSIYLLSKSNPNFVYKFLLTILFVLPLIITVFIYNSQILLSELFQLLIIFGILLSSIHIKFNISLLKKAIYSYIYSTCIMGLVNIFYYGSGFVISEQYLNIAKNQIGPIVSIAIILIIPIIFLNKNNLKKKIFDIVIFLLLFFTLLVIRNRSGLLGVIIILILMLVFDLLNEISKNKLFLLNLTVFLLLILIITGQINFILQPVWDSFTSNYNVYNLEELSAGRVEVYIKSIQFIKRNPMFGEISMNSFIEGTPHNYLLNKAVSYGVVFSFPLFLFYFYLWKFTIIELWINRENSIFNKLPFYLMLLSLIISVFEYSYPYGPGVSQIMVWFILGQYLKKDYLI